MIANTNPSSGGGEEGDQTTSEIHLLAKKGVRASKKKKHTRSAVIKSKRRPGMMKLQEGKKWCRGGELTGYLDEPR